MKYKFKMKRFAIVLFIISCSLAVLHANSEVRLPAVIGDHMVLQQQSEVKLWGWCDPNEKIKVSPGWDTVTYKTVGNPDGKWLLSIKTTIAGGPYNLTISGNNKVVIEDVLIGEVWACSGQSNMEMNYNWGISEYKSDADNATSKSIRFFHIPRLTSQFPQDDTKGQWVVCNPEDMKKFSLAGYFFGQKLREILSVPVGLIEADWGGTPAEVWTPKDAIDNNAVIKKTADELKVIPWGPIKVAACYNAMIYPVTNYNIAGVIWYQGEANVENASTYETLFSSMITSWRKAWQKDFPFYFVQIASFAGYGNNISGPLLKEAQTKTLATPNTGMIVIDDHIADINNIHPTDKKDVGYRLANLALSQTYGKTNFPYKYPMFKSMQIKNEKATIYFTNAENGLKSKEDTISGFNIAGNNKIFMPATAKIVGNKVEVWNKSIKNPVAVRFDFTNSSIPELFSEEGLPVNLFRTDNWDDVKTLNN
jgi:sialate O-acetylesterase